MEKLSKLKFANLPQLTDEEMKLVAGGCGSGITPPGGGVICYIQRNSYPYSSCYKSGNMPSNDPSIVSMHCNCPEAFSYCGSA